MSYEEQQMSSKKVLALALVGVMSLIGLVMIGKLGETVDAGEIVVMQDPIDGDLNVWTNSGLYFQNFGGLTVYKKSAQHTFSAPSEGGSEKDASIRVRFNDGGHANISGSIRFELPLGIEQMKRIHTLYGSQEAVEREIVHTIVDKSLYFSGPLMSSKESYSDRRSDLIQYIVDQIDHGVYRTEAEEVKETDPLSGEEKTVTRVKFVRDESGNILRQQKSLLEELGIKTYNFTINTIKYDEVVEKQIQQQQQAIMDIQTAIAEAKKAEQKAITAAKEGEADAAKAKWDQEVLKATAVTKAEQEREVARLAMESADFTKQEQILLGEGEAARKKAVMQADGALDKKLSAWIEVNKAYAAELGKQRWVPEVQMCGGGNSGSGGSAGFMDMINMLMAKNARDLALDMRTQGLPSPSHNPVQVTTSSSGHH